MERILGFRRITVIKLLKNIAKKFKESRGYSLTELSISTSIIAMLAVGGLSLMQKKSAVDSEKETVQKMKVIEDAIKGFVTVNKYLPCPALPDLTESVANFGKSEGMTIGTPAAVTVATIYDTTSKTCSNNGLLNGTGAVPVKTLKLDNSYAYDGWGRKFTYRTADSSGANTDFDDPTFRGDIAIVDIKGIHKTNINNPPPFNNGAAYVIISYGSNGKNVAWIKNAATGSNNPPAQATGIEGKNTNHSQKIYIQAMKNNNFDDIVVYGVKSNLIAPKTVTPPIDIQQLTCDNANTVVAAGRSYLDTFAANTGSGGSTARADVIFKAAQKIQLMCSNKPTNNFDPSTMAGIQLWLDSADPNTLFTNSNCTAGGNPSNGNSILCWKYKTANIIMCIIHATANNQPTYVTGAFNNRPVVSFDGSNDYMQTSGNFSYNNTNSNGITVVTAFRDAFASNSTLINWRTVGNVGGFSLQGTLSALSAYAYATGAWTAANSSGWSSSSDYILIETYGSGVVTQWRNGVSVATANAGATLNIPTAPLNMGSDIPGTTNYLVGKIGEVMIFNRALNSKEKGGIESYLSDKWGVTLTTAPNSLCSNGMVFTKSKDRPEGSCTCPSGTDLITNLQRKSGCYLEANKGFSGCVPIQSAPTYTNGPTDSGLTLWLDSNDCTSITLASGSKIDTWKDKSANAKNATQSTDSARPLYTPNILNGKPIVRFDGTNDMLSLPTGVLPTGNTPYTLFSLVSAASTANNGGWLSLANTGVTSQSVAFRFDSGNFIYQYWWGNDVNSANNSIVTNNWYIVDTPYDTSTGRVLYINGQAVGTSTAINRSGSESAGALSVGRAAGATEFLNGDIAEILVYNRTFRNADRVLVERYLADKWGIFLLPTDNLDLDLWLDADDPSTIYTNTTSCTGYNASNGDSVGCWKDKSSNARSAVLRQSQVGDAVVPSSDTRPTLLTNQIQGRSTLSFDGSSLQVTGLDVSPSVRPKFTTTFVAQFFDSNYAGGQIWGNDNGAYDTNASMIYTGGNFRWAFNGSQTTYSTGSNVSMGTPYIITTQHSASMLSVWINGTVSLNQQALGIAYGSGLSDFCIGMGGSPWGSYMKGQLAELTLYNRHITDNERLYLERYLGNKWGVTVP